MKKTGINTKNLISSEMMIDSSLTKGVTSHKAANSMADRIMGVDRF